MSEQRRYSFNEIELMRQMLSMSYPDGVCYMADERSKEIEERVRTLMVGGVDPQEVVENCRKIVAQRQQFKIDMQKRAAGTPST